MIPPTSIDGTDITGATIDGTDVTEITVDGDTVFSASPIFDFEDGTSQGLTINNFLDGSFSVGSETNTPNGTFSANGIDDNVSGIQHHGNIELPVTGVPFRVKFNVFIENTTDATQGVGVFGTAAGSAVNTEPGGNFVGFVFYPTSNQNEFEVRDGSTQLTSSTISQPLNAEYSVDFDIDASKNYTISVSRGGSVQVSDTGSFTGSFSAPVIMSRGGGGNVGKNLFDNIVIS